MKVVTTNLGLKDFGVKYSIKTLKRAGFDGFDYHLNSGLEIAMEEFGAKDYLDLAKKIKTFLNQENLPCVQTHSAMGTRDKPYEEVVLEHKKRLEISAILGAKYSVVHPIFYKGEEFNSKVFYPEIIDFSKDLGVIVLTENMWDDDKKNGVTYPDICGTAQSFKSVIDNCERRLFACLDIGHAEMPNCEGAVKMIEELGGRIKALHVHDNDKIKDSHNAPFSSLDKINWEGVISALKSINYSGDFTFETYNCIKRYPQELHLSALKHLCDIGRYFVEKLN